MEMMVPRRIQELRAAKEAQKQKEEASKKAPTQRQLNTIQVIHELVSEYDRLQRVYAEDPTNQNKRKIQEYSLNLKSKNSLAKLLIQHIDANELDTITAPSKIRALITNEINNGSLIRINGLIRSPHTVPYENVSASGNVITIILPKEYVSPLVDALVPKLIDEPVKFVVPCNNMVMIIELGNCKSTMDPDLFHTIRNTLALFLADHHLWNYPEDNKPNTYILKHETDYYL